MSDTIPDAGDNGLGFGFGAKDVARISETVRRVEATYRNAPPGRARGPVAASGGLVPCFVASGFAAGTAAVPATATVTLGVISGNGFAGGASTETGYNPYTKSITGSATKIIWMTRKNGKLYVVTADC